jgi:signal transduction protein with GAF and PtsI domain
LLFNHELICLFSKQGTGESILTDRKRWTIEEETQLKALVGERFSLEEISSKLQKTPGAVMVKCQRLGLLLQTEGYVNSSISIPRELPSVEEALKMLAGALKASVKPGLNRLEVQRLEAVANISKTYKELLADYVNYRDVERKLKEMEEENAALKQALKEIRERSSNSTP